jgi:hypothetical protein
MLIFYFVVLLPAACSYYFLFSEEGHCKPLLLAAKAGEVTKLKDLLSNGANINCKGVDGRTPLHSVAEMGRIDKLKVILEQKVLQIEAKDKDGRTPLHLATVNEHNIAFQILCAKGADINAIALMDKPHYTWPHTWINISFSKSYWRWEHK